MVTLTRNLKSFFIIMFMFNIAIAVEGRAGDPKPQQLQVEERTHYTRSNSEPAEIAKFFVQKDLGQGTGSVWNFVPGAVGYKIDELVQEGKECFRKIVNYALENNIFLNEPLGINGMGIKQKKGGARFVSPFTPQGIKTSVSFIDSRIPADLIRAWSQLLARFHDTMEPILKKVGLRSEHTEINEVVTDVFREENRREIFGPISKFLHEKFNIFKSPSGLKAIQTEFRAVIGPARHQDPHIDGKTLAVLSFDIRDVYEQCENAKAYFANGEHYFWLGEQVSLLLNKEEDPWALETIKNLVENGVDPSLLKPLPHGVDYNQIDSNRKEKEDVSFLLIFKNSEPGYYLHPKSIENFQNPILIRNQKQTLDLSND